MHIVRGVRSALVFSDVHLGWSICARHHAEWLARLPEAAGDADLIVLNGDVVDGFRLQHAAEREVVSQLAELVAGWRAEGRRVFYLEGNHDAHAGAAQPLGPDGWLLDFETAAGERVRVLHGHRFSDSEPPWSAYDRVGRSVLGIENLAYDRIPALHAAYRAGPGWFVSAVGALECFLARRGLPARVASLVDDVDVLLHGHIHYGPGEGRIGSVATFRTGSFVSPGHLRTADRMLRYRDGRFERIGWSGGSWRAFSDGR
jgi:UDP-2,3-diacylglucosamine pyrophosphatase LpxH